MICKTCGEMMIGNGYNCPLHCPNADAEGREPDADPVHCKPDPIELAQLIAQRKHDTGTPEYTLAVALLEYHAVLEEAGETNDGEYRLCCIGKALNYTVPDRE